MFKVGNLVQTSSIAQACKNDYNFLQDVRKCLARYMKKDWGDTYNGDKELNDNAVACGDDRIVASYNIGNRKIFIITEWDRSVTTILFAEEY